MGGALTPASVASLSRRVAAAANRVLALARAVGRDDLAERVQTEAARWGQADTSVIVVGGSRAGKTLLIDALCGAPVLPAGQATAAHVLVREAADRTVLRYENDEDEPVELEPSALPELAAADGGVIDVHWTGTELPSGMILVDTPAIDAVDEDRRRRALDALGFADAAIVCVPASAPVTAADLDLLRRLGERVDRVIVAFTWIDRLRGWERIIDDSRRIFERDLPGVTLVDTAVSGRLAALCWEDADLDPAEREDLLEESGIGRLRSILDTEVLGRSQLLRLANLTRICTGVVAHLLQVEQVALDTALDPAQSGPSEELVALQRQMESLGRDSSVWLIDFADRLNLLREDLTTAVGRAGSSALEEVSRRLEDRDLAADDFPDALAALLADAQERLLEQAESGVRSVVEQAIEAVRSQTVLEVPIDDVGPERDESPSEDARSSSGGVDLGLVTRVGAMVATSGSGVAMMLMTVDPGAGGVMNVARGVAFGAAALMGTASGAVTIRQSKRGRAAQEVLLAGRQAVDDWRTSTGARLRRMLLKAQRVTERELKQLIIERRDEVEALVKAAQSDARADAAERKARAEAGRTRLDKLSTVRAELELLATELRSVRG